MDKKDNSRRAKIYKYTDTQIMDALDAVSYNMTKAAERLGMSQNGLYVVISNNENLRKYYAHRLQVDAVKARDKLDHIMTNADPLDPKQMGHVISTCKILLDKAEASKLSTEVSGNLVHKIDSDLDEKLRRLLG